MITVRSVSLSAFIVAAIACGGATTDVVSLDGGPGGDGSNPQSDAANQQDGSQQADTSTTVAPIPCGNGVTCDPSTQVCCATQQGASCTAIGQCKGASFSCTSTANCTNGEVCCGSFMNQMAQAVCQPQCTGMEAQLCQDTSECKQPGYTCRPLFQGLKVCAPPIPDGGFKLDASPPPKDASAG